MLVGQDIGRGGQGGDRQPPPLSLFHQGKALFPGHPLLDQAVNHVAVFEPVEELAPLGPLERLGRAVFAQPGQELLPLALGNDRHHQVAVAGGHDPLRHERDVLATPAAGRPV